MVGTRLIAPVGDDEDSEYAEDANNMRNADMNIERNQQRVAMIGVDYGFVASGYRAVLMIFVGCL